MTNQDQYVTSSELSATSSSRVGFYSAIMTTVITVITLVLGMTAMPISGPNCRVGCIEYPYLDTVLQFPKDYLWMFSATLLILAYVSLVASIHSSATSQKKIFSQIGLSFAIVTAAVFLSDFFIQFSVMPASLVNGETEGITLLTQYNPHGIFIVLEELGYLIMSLSFLFMAPVFANQNRLESSVQWVFIVGFILTIISLATISFHYGIDRKDHFEVLAIMINWFVLMIYAGLLSIVFRRRLKEKGKV